MAKPRTYHVVTLGCPKNDVDSEHFERMLGGGGLVSTESPTEADAIIVNTCGFIEQSQEQSYETIEALSTTKRSEQTLIVAGCLTQLYAGEVRRQFPSVDHVFGVGQWPDVAKLLSVDVDAVFDIPDSGAVVKGPSAYLKISDGCDAPCTFCVIPTIKGGLRSAPVGFVLKEAQSLVEAGAKELVLVAQDSTAYGEDLGVKHGLSGLLRMLNDAVGDDIWLRIMYAYPSRVRDDVIEAMASVPSVIPYLDVPLQHGSESMLRRMKRPSNMTNVRNMVEKLRAAMPEIVLRTSMIVGFPGETESEFRELEAFMQEAQFDHLGVFTYSQQQWTPAAELEAQVTTELKEERRHRLMSIQQGIAAKRAATFVGRRLSLLVEGIGEDEAGEPVVAGRSYREAPEVDGLVFAAGSATPGERIDVRITASADYDLFGEVVSP